MPLNASFSSRDKLEAGIFPSLAGFGLVFWGTENEHLHSLH